jgi:hypothetical protein
MRGEGESKHFAEVGYDNQATSNNSFNRSANRTAFIVNSFDLLECCMPRPVNSSVRPLHYLNITFGTECRFRRT